MPATWGRGPIPTPPVASLRRSLYVARNLLCVVVAYHPVDMPPDTLVVDFVAEEPAGVAEVHRLTLDLWEVILRKSFERQDAATTAGDGDAAATIETRLATLYRVATTLGVISCFSDVEAGVPPPQAGGAPRRDSG